MASNRSRSKQVLRAKRIMKTVDGGKKYKGARYHPLGHSGKPTGKSTSKALKDIKALSKVKKFKKNRPLRLSDVGNR